MKSIKYILLVTVILFVFVFLVTLPGRSKDKNDDSSTSETTSEVTTVSESIDTAVENGTSAIVVGGEPDETTTSGGSAETTSSTTTNNASATGENWAYYLINQTNPLPSNFTVKTKKVFGQYEMDERCADSMIKMLADGKTAGVNISVISAYRSIDYQKNLLDKDTKKYQAQGLSYDEAYKKATSAVAIPGQSEHNAGLSADLLESGNYTLTENFDQTPEFKWLSANADKYGFILRYPKGKETITGIEYEPWHYRYVGVTQAQKIKASGLCLEEYIKQNP